MTPPPATTSSPRSPSPRGTAKSKITVIRCEDAAASREQFRRDVLHGLRQPQKSLPSWYFYDDTGSQLYQQITGLPEYYPIASETHILTTLSPSIVAAHFLPSTPFSSGPVLPDPRARAPSGVFNVIELGVGDGRKSAILLRKLLEEGVRFRYVPVDISRVAVRAAVEGMERRFGGQEGFECHGLVADNLEALEWVRRNEPDGRNFVMFLGSSLGNYTPAGATEFLRKIRDSLNEGDQLFMGLDLLKDPSVLIPAYSDSLGVTAKFNLNLIHRINRELQGNLDVKDFQHHASFNALTGAMESFLLAKRAVRAEIAGEEVAFKTYEAIHVECSQKYRENEVGQMAEAAGFELVCNYKDTQGWYLDTVWKVTAP